MSEETLLKYPSNKKLFNLILKNIFCPILMAKRFYALAQAFHEVPMSIKTDAGCEVICVSKDNQLITIGTREDVPWIFYFFDKTNRTQTLSHK